MNENNASQNAQQQYPFHKRFVRKRVKIRIEVERFQEAIESSSVNISPSGMCFLVREPLEEQERMRLLCMYQGKEVRFSVSGRVVWQEDADDEMFMVGAAFEQFALGDERRIRQWLLELSDKPAETK